jgi:hypothetical protein
VNSDHLKPGDVLTVQFADSVVLSVDRGHIEVQTAHAEIVFELGAPDVEVSNHRRPIKTDDQEATA